MDSALGGLVDSWELHLRAGGAAASTVRQYRRIVTAFAAAAGAVDLADGSALTAALAAHLADLGGRLAPATVAVRYAALHSFFTWCVAEDEVASHPMARLRRPPVPERPVDMPTVAQVAAVLAGCDPRTFDGRRDTAMLRLLLDAGVRRAELAGMRLADVNLREQTAVVLGKGARHRVVVYGRKTTSALDRYLRARARHVHADHPALWLGRKGPMSVEGVYDMVVRRGQAAGVALHPHQLRHLFAHSFLADGGNETDLRRLGGWRSPAVMARYGSALADSRAADAGRRLSLGDRL